MRKMSIFERVLVVVAGVCLVIMAVFIGVMIYMAVTDPHVFEEGEEGEDWRYEENRKAQEEYFNDPDVKKEQEETRLEEQGQ